MKIKFTDIVNPKRKSHSNGFEGWYPYYAGYSTEFVSRILNTSSIERHAVVLDPWNGSGTTTTAVHGFGLQAAGFDMNPVMVLAAKSCLVSRYDYVSLKPLAAKIVEMTQINRPEIAENDPLLIWFKTQSACYIKCIENSIQQLLFDQNQRKNIANNDNLGHISSVAAFFYVALFRTITLLVASFRSSNPTWIKVPRDLQTRKSPSNTTVSKIFLDQVRQMFDSVQSENICSRQSQLVTIEVGDSCQLSTDSNSVDLIISSPPYCTRIDYAVATLPELTLLGYSPKNSFVDLRKKLIGSATISSDICDKGIDWGEECNRFLEGVFDHKSKASKTYYFKSHLQYFNSIFKSINEIGRILKKDGNCILVVQDSHYKDIYNDVPLIITQMASKIGLELVREERFVIGRNMAKINPSIRKYRSQINATESVLCFHK